MSSENEADAPPASASASTDASTGDEPLDASPLWQLREEEGWELTWPIWHLLPRGQRKEIASKAGYSSIGEFEEYMSLQRAVDFSETHPSSKISFSSTTEDFKTILPDVKESSGVDGEVSDEDEDDEEEREYAAHQNSQKSTQQSTEELSPEELLEVGGMILMLHDELFHQVFSYLPVDMYGTLALVSPHWKHLTRTESVYKRLCERLYLNQSKRRALHVSRFGNSYRKMLELRPRVRAAGGCYVLKYAQVKKIQRDMWTEIPIGAVLETVYYRYLYFQEDGRVLYALTSQPPHVMFRRLLKICLTKEKDPAAVWGTYQVQKNNCTITAQQEWHTIKFELTIEVNSMYGRFGGMVLDRHLSSPSGNFDEYWSQDLVEYQVPTEHFRFVKDKRL